jgi:hypothetical protein
MGGLLVVMNMDEIPGYPKRAKGLGIRRKDDRFPLPKWNDDKVPFTTVDLWVKQINASKLNDLGKAALTYAFAGFLHESADKHNIAEFTQSMNEQLRELGGFKWEASTTRRFAGDASLPRGRYFSLCDSSGFDNGTLVRELRTYYNPEVSGIPQIFDLTDPKDHQIIVENAGFENISPENIVLLFLPVLGQTSSIAQKLASYTSTDFYGLSTGRTGICVLLPLTISHLHLKRTIDLRKPDVAAWFSSTMSRLQWDLGGDTPIPCFPERSPVDTFFEVLPEVLAQEIGGGGFCKAAGIFLRQLGANALIYPSARTDADVAIDQGMVTKASGWNIVDYEKSQALEMLAWIEMGTDWPTAVGIRPGPEIPEDQESIWFYEVEFEDKSVGPEAGSWRVHGLRRRLEAHWRFNQMLYAFNCLRESLSSRAYKEILSWLSSYLIEGDTNSGGGFSNLVLECIMGVAGSKRKLIEVADKARTADAKSLSEALNELIEICPV